MIALLAQIEFLQIRQQLNAIRKGDEAIAVQFQSRQSRTTTHAFGNEFQLIM
jgi:hypothetical protein